MPSFLTYVEYEKHIKRQQKNILKGNMVFTRPNVKEMVSGHEFFFIRDISITFANAVKVLFACF
jgi:hypothetical protein